MLPGLVSVTFRNMSPQDICALCAETGLKAIEWGGDVHVPPTGQNAAQVRQMSADAGLEICSYGSYYRVGRPMDDFRRCLDTACALGTRVIRVWCGENVESERLSAQKRSEIVGGLLECCAVAQGFGMIVAPEFHGGTLTDSLSSVERLLDETRGVDNLRFYWQPRWDWTQAQTLRALELVRPRLAHAHVFTWRHEGEKIIRLPLCEGEATWKKALPMLGDCRALLEFVRADERQALVQDAATLRRWIENWC